MPDVLPTRAVLVECVFCRSRFDQTLARLTRDRALLCPHCASVEELDNQELQTIVAAAVTTGAAQKEPGIR